MRSFAKKTFLSILPPRYRLPFLYRIQLLKESCENELRYLHRIYNSSEAAIDIGAHEGWYSYAMSKLFSKVYSFEINDEIIDNLDAYKANNIQIQNIGLSSKREEVILYIPIVNNISLPGWASLTPSNHPGAQETIQKKVKVCPLDDFNFQEISFIKIDVEGHEVEVLKGARDTLTRCHPTVLIEVKNKNLDEVTLFFEEINYKRCRLEDLIGVSGTEDNFIFIPT